MDGTSRRRDSLAVHRVEPECCSAFAPLDERRARAIRAGVRRVIVEFCQLFDSLRRRGRPEFSTTQVSVPPTQISRRPKSMRSPALFRSALAALIVTFAGLSQAHAESGTVTLTVYKGGWIIGGSAGGGTLNFRGRQLRALGRRHRLRSRVRRLEDLVPRPRQQHQPPVRCRRASPRRGRRGSRRSAAAPAGSCSPSQKGAVLELSGHQVGSDGECRPERPRDHDEVIRREPIGVCSGRAEGPPVLLRGIGPFCELAHLPLVGSRHDARKQKRASRAAEAHRQSR